MGGGKTTTVNEGTFLIGVGGVGGGPRLWRGVISKLSTNWAGSNLF